MSLLNAGTIDQTDFITKATANVTPSADINRVPKMESDGKISEFFLPNTRAFIIKDAVNGATTPQAVYYNKGVILGSASNAAQARFLGFTKGTATFQKPTFVNKFYVDANSTTSFAATAYAGNNRLLLAEVLASTAPTGITWNGTAMTLVRTQGGLTVWSLVIGSNASNQALTMVVTGGSWSGDGAMVLTTYSNTDQTAPVTQSVGGTTAPAIDGTAALSTIVAVVASSTAAVTVDAAFTNDFTQVGTGGFSGFTWNGGNVKYYRKGSTTAYTMSGAGVLSILLELNAVASVTTVDVKFNGVADGFTGLTIGLPYYLQNTAGTIGLTAGTVSVVAGIALSATELLLTPRT